MNTYTKKGEGVPARMTDGLAGAQPGVAAPRVKLALEWLACLELVLQMGGCDGAEAT